MLVLSNKNILITAGSTRGYLDAVRYITNTSTGKLGSEIAYEAMSQGAVVTYVYGTDSLVPVIKENDEIKPSQLKLVEIETNDDLVKVIQGKLQKKRFDAIVHAMAVADYVPARVKPGKTPSKKREWLLKLVKTPKVITIIRDMWPDALLVGFKLEVNRTKDDLIKTAKEFLTKTGANFIVANDYKNISRSRHIAYIVTADSKVSKPLKGKSVIAKDIVSCLGSNLK